MQPRMWRPWNLTHNLDLNCLNLSTYHHWSRVQTSITYLTKLKKKSPCCGPAWDCEVCVRRLIIRLNCKRITFLLCKERRIVVPEEFHTFWLKITSHPGQIPTPSAPPGLALMGSHLGDCWNSESALGNTSSKYLKSYFTWRAIYTFLKHKYNLNFLTSSQLLNLCISTYRWH